MFIIEDKPYNALVNAGRDDLAARIAAVAGPGARRADFRDYVDECIAAGVTSHRDIAEVSLLLARVDRAGRPVQVQRILDDPDVEGPLKAFQISHAVAGRSG